LDVKTNCSLSMNDNPNKRKRTDDPGPPRPRPTAENEKLYFDSYSNLGIHEDMIRDASRTNSYRNAMLQNPSDFKDAIVLDVGCGTGILSIFAIQAGAKHVYAIDASEIVTAARELIEHNNLTSKITIIKGKIEEVSLPVEKVDIIISEWMGYFLIYESMLESVFAARNNWLKPGGKMYPSSAHIYIAPFADEEYYNSRVNFWNQMYGIDFAPLQPYAKKSSLLEPQIEYLRPEGELSFPFKLFSIDCEKDTYDNVKAFRANFELTPIVSARMNGIMSFFDVEFCGTDKTVVLSTGPNNEGTHWFQTLFFLDDPISVTQHDLLRGTITAKQQSENHRFYTIQIDCSINTHHITKVFELK